MLLPDDRLIHHEHHEAPRGPSYLALMRDAKLQPLWVVTLLFSLAISSRLSFVAPFAYQKGIATVGVYFFIYALVGVVVRIVGRRVLDRVGLAQSTGSLAGDPRDRDGVDCGHRPRGGA